MDPRRWDLQQLLAAFEFEMKSVAKDEAAWRRHYAELTAMPKAVREEESRRARQPDSTSAPERMSVDEAEAMLARFSLGESQYRSR